MAKAQIQVPIPDLEFQLKKLFVLYSEIFDVHQWPLERSRWDELLFALLTNVLHEPKLRIVIEGLRKLELIDIKELSEIPFKGETIDMKSSHARKIADFLAEADFSNEEINDSILIMHEAASNMKTFYDGKIQAFLRKYGHQMIEDLLRTFKFSKLSKEELRHDYSLWLQNIINMPVSLDNKIVEAFCKDIGVNPKKLIEEADHLGLNMALVDDMIDKYMDDRAQKKAVMATFSKPGSRRGKSK